MYVKDRDIKHSFLTALYKLGIKSAKEPMDGLFIMKILRALEINGENIPSAEDVTSLQETLEKATFDAESLTQWITTSTKKD